MSKEKEYYQCRLAQGNARTVGYIEARGAKMGAQVEIEELGGFWEVIGVGHGPVIGNELREKQRMDRNSFASIKPKEEK